MSGVRGLDLDHFFWCTSADHFAALFAGFGAEVDDVVGIFDDVEVVLDDDDGVALVDKRVQDGAGAS